MSTDPERGADTRHRVLPFLQLAPLVLYGVVYWTALLVQLLFSVSTWRYTVTYDYFCGNPLMGNWSGWFIVSLLAGLILLPGGVWALRHRRERIAVVYAAGFFVYIVSMICMFWLGIVWDTVPDFLSFPPW